MGAALGAGWVMAERTQKGAALRGHLRELRARVKATLKAAHERVKGKELTPQLELLESGRMLEAAMQRE